MTVVNSSQDLADRYYKLFEEKNAFGRLTQLAGIYGTEKVEWAIGELKEKNIFKLGYLAKLLKGKYE